MTIYTRSIIAALLLTACARQEEAPAADRSPSADPPVDETRVRALEQRVRALARTGGCDRVDQCAAAPVGAKACGGPRTYLVYCKATTDEAALLRALDELKRAEEAYNRAAGIMSDCSITPQPEARLEGRTCTAVP
jgi:hypothetical protein